jgi:hypothetical protein
LLAAAGALVAGALVSAAPVQAATGNIDYNCDIVNGYGFTFTFNQDTNLPVTAVVGKTYAPAYTASTMFPESAVNIARAFGVTPIDGSVQATVYVNGHATTVTAPIKKTSVPASGALTLKASGPWPSW